MATVIALIQPAISMRLWFYYIRLKILNLSSNALTSLPPLNEIEDLNKVQELYLTQNSLQNDCILVISGYQRLKILHLAYNEITHISVE